MFMEYKAANKTHSKRFNIRWQDRYLQLEDRSTTTPFDSHYIYHPAWAARIIELINPPFHVDISSSLNFSTMLSAFIPTQFYDYRPAQIRLDNLHCGAEDVTHLSFKDNSISSLSCMHVIEHIGLGRYGDYLDPVGDIKAVDELKRVLSHEGHLLVVVPVSGVPRIEFNAHRVYSYTQIIDLFNEFELKDFSLIQDTPEGGQFYHHASKEQSDLQHYGCGCFWFQKT